MSLRTQAEVNSEAQRPDVKDALAHWAVVTGRPQFLTDLESYLDTLVLAVPVRDLITDLHTGRVEALVLGDRQGGSGFGAIRDFIDSLWANPTSAVASRMRSLRRRWSSQTNRAVPVACLSETFDDNNPNQKIFVSPDPEYAAHIIEV